MALLFQPEGLLRLLQQAVYDTFNADAGFADVALVDIAPGDITSTVEAALQGLLPSRSGKSGLTLLIWPPEIEHMEGTGGGVGQPLAQIKLELINFQSFNFAAGGPNLWPSAAAWRALTLLKNRAFRWLGVCLITPAKPIEVQQADSGDVRYLVYLNFYMPVVDETRVATPTISVVNTAGTATFALSCVTAGAAIYYTLADAGSLPVYPSQAAGTLYTGPVALTASKSMLAAAYADSVPASEVLAQALTVIHADNLVTGDGDNRITGDGDDGRTTGDVTP